MKITATSSDILLYDGDALIVNLFDKVKKPGGAAEAVDQALGGVITKLIADGQIKGKLGATTVIPAYGKLHARKIVIVGLGKKEDFNADRVRIAVAAACVAARKAGAKRCGTILHGAGAGGLSPEEAARAVAEGAILGLYRFIIYKSKSPEINIDKDITELTVIEREKVLLPAVLKGINLGRVMAESTNMARDLTNEPPNVLTPAELAKRAKEILKLQPVTVQVLGKREIEKLEMGAFLGVARGSAQEPRFIIMSYKGNPRSKETMALIGKGITFDSGGISLKPSNAMDDMKGDMAGAACVIAAMRIIASLAPKINVTALVPTTENMPGGNAQKVGDVTRAMNGKTIEINNTDAEGRLILADAICYAKKQGLSPIIDVATLTGACMVALGTVRTGAFTNNQKLLDGIIDSSLKTGDRLWQLPTDEEYKEMNKSDIADIKNAGGRYAGATTGALFCEFFAEDTPWVHLDIAGTSFMDKPKGYYAVKGGTGAVARTLAQYVLDVAK